MTLEECYKLFEQRMLACSTDQERKLVELWFCDFLQAEPIREAKVEAIIASVLGVSVTMN